MQDKVGVVNTNKPIGGENLPTKEPPRGKTQVQQESPHKWKKRQPQSIQRDQRNHTIESHRNPTKEIKASGIAETKRDT